MATARYDQQSGADDARGHGHHPDVRWFIVVKGTLGAVLALIALVPIAGGLLDFCVAGVVMGYPFSGKKAREQITQERRR